MSNALDALMNMSNDDIAAYTSEPETEGYIVIGNDRRITVPETLKRIAVQYDHNIETVTFDCPRYWDDHDMSKMIVYINYRLPNGDLGSYIAANIKASGDRMTFEWTILKDVTQYKGNIAFLVCVKKTDSEGIEENHWNSELCTDMYISEGLETVASVTYDYPDLVNQLLERMTTVEQINVQADEMQVLHDETLDAAEVAETARTESLAVKESVDASEEHIRNSYANAIRNTESGSFIRVNDVSSIEHTVKTKVRSKNLIPLPYDEVDGEKSGATFTALEDGGIRVVGTASFNTSFNLTMQYKKRLLVEKGKTYTVSVTSTLTAARGYVFVQNWANGEVVDNKSVRQGSLTFVASDDGSVQIGIVLLEGQVYDEVMYIWLEEGSTATDYSTYVDPSTVTLTRSGKNLVHDIGYSYEGSGITWTVNDDGTVIADGTAATKCVCNFKVDGCTTSLVGQTVTLSGCPAGGAIETYAVMQRNYGRFDVGNGITFVVDNKNHSMWGIVINEGVTVNNLKFAPQLEVGSSVTDFELSSIEKHTPSSDGTVEGVTSVSPTMCVYANKTGTILDVEYNVDTKAYIDYKLDSGISTALEAIMNDSY